MSLLNFKSDAFLNYNDTRDLGDLLDVKEIEDAREKWDYYHNDYLDINVPRVTNILRSTIGRDELNNWAASLGENYKSTKQSILNTGTLVHAMIDDFILLGSRQDVYLGTEYENAYMDQADTAYNNFVEWWFDFHNKGCKIEPIAIEKVITCPWYGGTADFIANITYPDGRSYNYILDFKTSKQIGFDYFIQTRMYMNAVNSNICLGIEKELPSIGGIGIIRVDKQKKVTQFLAADVNQDMDFLINLDYSISAMLTWYYEQTAIKSQVGAFKRDYKKREF